MITKFDVQCKIANPLEDVHGRKYLQLELPPDVEEQIFRTQLMNSNLLKFEKIKNSLVRNVLEVKVPYRYNRVMCTTEGITSIHSLKEGDSVRVIFSFGGAWNTNGVSGFTWKLNLLDTTTMDKYL